MEVMVTTCKAIMMAMVYFVQWEEEGETRDELSNTGVGMVGSKIRENKRERK